MFIETRFLDNGRAEARLSETLPEPDPVTEAGGYDLYVDEVDDLTEWAEDNIESDDIAAFVKDLEDGGWVNITDCI